MNELPTPEELKTLNDLMQKIMNANVMGKAIEDGEITEEGQRWLDMIETLDMLTLLASDKRLYIVKAFLSQAQPPAGRGVIETTDRRGRNVRIKPRQNVTSIDVTKIKDQNRDLYNELAKKYPSFPRGRAETIEISGGHGDE